MNSLVTAGNGGLELFGEIQCFPPLSGGHGR